MYKGFAVSAALLLLVASGATAVGLVQHQATGLLGKNGVTVVGDGAAGNINALTTDISQLGTHRPTHTTAFQGTTGALMQSAGAVGMVGFFDVDQVAYGGGWQTQVPASGLQGQDLNAWLAQDVTKIGGQGSALGLQTFVGVQTQLTFTPWGGSANVQGIGVSLYDAVGGGPGGGMQVAGGADISAGQY
ncbi:hypothetical protein [Anaerobaca lacustris]|uniref:Uncharacterized protein n=1 Tax=Anaerobaca lacustris TaxID=3044600 RepID=A0AAW6TW10_9BACT|nr:hypothetical protein [Sedimentisphaerales bacterium M17dextr]